MKLIIKVFFFILAIVLLSRCEKDDSESPPETNTVSIPDINFLNALILNGVDKNGDGKISPAETENIEALYLENSNISNLTGIKAFVNLNTLDCSSNNLTSLDVSNNTALEYLDCWYNQLISLDVSNNTSLVYLNCNANQLSNLNVSNNTALKLLYCCCNTQLTTLDVSNCTAIEELNCADNQLTTLDVSNCTNLEWLYCKGNQLTTMDISNCTALKSLYCGENQLATLDISNNLALETLSIYEIPTLYEVCVWTIPFPPGDIIVNKEDSPNAYFTIDCSE